jgi:heme A synthase
MYVAMTAFFIVNVLVGTWVAFSSDEWAVRYAFALGAAVFAWAAYVRIRWLFSADATIHAAPAPAWPPDAP